MNQKKTHRRYNPLSGTYVLVSPHRLDRPWQGKQESVTIEKRPEHDPNCYLCAGNVRANGKKNPNYKDTFVFTNDFSSLLPDVIHGGELDEGLLKAKNVSGKCNVICFSPRHDLTLAEMELEDIQKVVEVWCSQNKKLGKKFRWVQIFENRGEVMGSSNPHPHGQIWASSFLPNEILREDENQKKYLQENGRILLTEYVQFELKKKERVVLENENWVVIVPYWATWPFETLLLPKRAVQRLDELHNNEKETLSEILKLLLIKYDNLFQVSFPYTMGWHGAPFDDKDNSHWQLHAHFYPPLLRSATIKKFMVGYEMLAESQRDITAEQAADMLRSLSEIHYKSNYENNK